MTRNRLCAWSVGSFEERYAEDAVLEAGREASILMGVWDVRVVACSPRSI
jgi:hypothetical protein